MIDNEILEQLKSVFASINKKTELVVDLSQHPQQPELLDLLEGVAQASKNIEVTKSSTTNSVPSFFIRVNGESKGIRFSGIPGGHEFSSLILAILNANGLGKMPDELLSHRIKKIKGPVRVKTYISLSCENCPDVVQAFNQMALLHGNFHHEMVDGGFVENEIESLGIQGVPSIVIDNKLFHSGKINFLDLLIKLENHFGVTESEEISFNKDLGKFDVLVIGGGPAGSSAAIYTVRKGFSTALITEKIGGQVQETRGIENLISVPYIEGPQLAGKLSEHISHYPIKTFEHRRIKKISTQKRPFHVELETGEHLLAQSIVVATGAKWRELNIPGEKEYIGRGVAFCPHCDGPYYKGKKVSVIGGGNSGVEAAIDLAGIVKEVTLFEYNDQLKADKILVDKLLSLKNVSVVTSAQTKQIIGDGAKVTAIEYLDRKNDQLNKTELDGVFVQIGLIPNSQFLKDTVELTKYGEIVVDSKGHTSVKGIYAAGDVTTTPFKQIIIAMGEGAKAGLALFEDSMLEISNH